MRPITEPIPRPPLVPPVPVRPRPTPTRTPVKPTGPQCDLRWSDEEMTAVCSFSLSGPSIDTCGKCKGL